MQELAGNSKFKKPSPAKDSKELNSLVGFLNDSRVTGAVVPRGENTKVIVTQDVPPAAAPVAAPVVPPPAAQPLPVEKLDLVFYTGRMMAGKDYVSAQCGQKIFSLAEPLYALQKLFFGTDDKKAPGARKFLQVAGQIGRNEVTEEYPLSIERASFIALVRETARAGLGETYGVDWGRFGANPNIWLDALVHRINDHSASNPGSKVAVVNVRFENEFRRLSDEGFVHYHVMCSPKTWTERLKAANLTPESPACKDLSERLAAGLDNSVTKQLSQRNGNRLRCIWSDASAAMPSNRLLSVSQFVSLFKQ